MVNQSEYQSNLTNHSMSNDFASYFPSFPTYTKHRSNETKHYASPQELFYDAKNGILEPLQLIQSSKIIGIIAQKLRKSDSIVHEIIV